MTTVDSSGELEEQVQQLVVQEAIKELRAEYCYRIDAFDWRGWSDLFIDDGVFSLKGRGTYKGREEIRRMGEEVIGANRQFSAHMVHNPIIEVNGDSATGQWYFENICVFGDGTPGMIQGEYDEEYRRVDGEWKFAAVRGHINYEVDYDEGWEKAINQE